MANQMHDFQSVMMTLLITITIPQFSRNGLMKLWRMRWILYYLLLNLLGHWQKKAVKGLLSISYLPTFGC